MSKTSDCGDRNGLGKCGKGVHSIHEMTVMELSELYGHPVAIKLSSGVTVYGNVYTVDPCTRSVALVQHFHNGDRKVVLVFGNNMEAINVLFEEGIPDGCLKYTEDFCSWLSTLFGVSQTESRTESKLRKQKLINWLEENTIDVVEEADGTLVVFGSVRIREPYTSKNCFCSVPLILSRICRLIDAMPSE